MPSLQISHELVNSHTNRIQIVFGCQLTFSTLAANLYTNCFLPRCNIACAALGPPAHEHCLKGCRHCLHTSCPTELYAVRHCLLTTCRTESAEENDSTNCRLQIVAFSLAFESSLAFEYKPFKIVKDNRHSPCHGRMLGKTFRTCQSW